MIRVGRCRYDNTGKRYDPSFPGFTNILVLMTHTEWGKHLGPYFLKNSNDEIFENYYQAHKIYEMVPKSIQRYSRYNNKVIWDHPAETHLKNDLPTKKYWKWRSKLRKNKFAVRYPVGFNYRGKCLYSLLRRPTMSTASSDKFIDCGLRGIYEKLDYIEARKELYVKKYCKLVKQETKFSELQAKLDSGENLLIIEVDAPHQEDLKYYVKKYDVDDNFIVDHSMVANVDNLKIMLNDAKHPFGHGYCLAIALLDIEEDVCS